MRALLTAPSWPGPWPAVLLGLGSLGAPAPQEAGKLGTFAREVGDLAHPSGAVLADDGTTWVLEWALDRVRTLSPTGEETARFGASGTEPGELRGPRDLAGGPADPEGLLWVADTGNHRVQAFTLEGEPVRAFGSWGPGAGELNAPQGLDVDAERVYVADTLNDRVQVFDRKGEPLFSFGTWGAADGELNHPHDVAVDADGALYVVDTDNHRVQKFSSAGEHLRSFGDFGPHPGFLAAPSGVTHHGGLLYVTDRENHRVQVFDREGQVAWTWGLHALLPRDSRGKLHYPRQVAIAPSGALAVVCEDQEGRLQVFGRAAEGEEPPAVGSLDRSTASHFGPRLATDFGPEHGLMVLLEPTRPGLRLYDTATELAGEEPIEITRSTPWGRGFGQMLRPEDAAIDAGRSWIHVADPALRKLETWRYDREPGPIGFDPYMLKLAFSRDLTAMSAYRGLVVEDCVIVDVTDEAPAWWPRQAVEPGALELHPQGHLLVADARNRMVLQIGSAGDYFEQALRTRIFPLWTGMDRLEQDGVGEDRLVEPVDLACSPSGERLYVVDRLAARVRSIGLRAGDGEAVLQLGEGEERDLVPPADAPFVRPDGIAVAPSGRVFVSDSWRCEVFAFDAEGSYLERFGSRGLGPVQFFHPAGLALKSPERLIVLDHGNHRAHILTLEGELVHAFGARLFTQPIREAFARQRRLEAGLPVEPEPPPDGEE